MILRWIRKRLEEKAFKERHALLKLEWERAELKRELKELKESAEEHDNEFCKK